jgi:quinohemoprotein amine dehydrogenase
MDVATEHLTGAFPLHTPEWSAWAAAMRPPRLAGRWALSGYQAGKGPFYGQVTITGQSGTPDSFVTNIRFTYARSGESVTRTSRGIVYTGFQWRGRSPDPANESNTWREVAFLERDGQQMTGRWFAGAYDEIGADVTLRRVGTDPVVTGTSHPSLRHGAATTGLRIYGANFPARLAASDIDFGQGVTVSRVAAVTPDMVTVDVQVAADARVGPRDLAVAGAVRPSAIVVYDRVDGLQVLPQAGMARVGGVVFPKQLQQFEALAVHNGADGKPNTNDDLQLGRVDAQWTIEEYAATFRDDDTKYVGAIDANGLFTPNDDGPNPSRSGNRNNIGDVWVVATHTPENGKPIRARAHLLVTVPLYMNWAPKEIAR